MAKYRNREGDMIEWGGVGVCEITVRLPMGNGAMETVEYMWVDI